MRFLPFVLSIIGVGALLGSDPPAFLPGEIWMDVDSQPIRAHGGGLLFHDGVYYWYGEWKEGPTTLPLANQAWGGTRVEAGGVSCYSSTNLYDWKKQGIVLPSNGQDPTHDLASENVIERPKVIYNTRTKKFVMWLHQDREDYQAARSGVAVSDSPTGPFHYLGSTRPNARALPANTAEHPVSEDTQDPFSRDVMNGQMARDMTLFVDEDGLAYHIYASEENRTLHIALLTDDYLHHSGIFTRAFPWRKMEAPALWKRKGKYYLIASGCTGWQPNPARSAVADHIFGPWTELGNPCRGPAAETTFGGQSTYVLPVVGRPDTYIALFDRWNPSDLAASRYLWLPLTFDAEGKPIVHWHDRWNL
jgi:hypothetical protein